MSRKIIEYHVIIPKFPYDHRDGFYPNLNDVSAAIKDLLADDDVETFTVRKITITELSNEEFDGHA